MMEDSDLNILTCVKSSKLPWIVFSWGSGHVSKDKPQGDVDVFAAGALSFKQKQAVWEWSKRGFSNTGDWTKRKSYKPSSLLVQGNMNQQLLHESASLILKIREAYIWFVFDLYHNLYCPSLTDLLQFRGTDLQPT